MNVDLMCPICFGHCEDMLHVFRDCDFARLVWAVSCLPHFAIYNQFSDVWDWIIHVKQVMDGDQFEAFVCICWCLWHHRNNVVHNNQKGDAPELVLFAGNYLQRYKEVQHHNSAPRPPESVSCWTPPTGATVTVNVDASILKHQGAAGIGVVARDSSGNVLAWRQRKVDFIQCPEMAETLALVEGVELAVSAGWREVLVESDCQAIIRDVNSQYRCLTSGGQFIEHIKNK